MDEKRMKELGIFTPKMLQEAVAKMTPEEIAAEKAFFKAIKQSFADKHQ